MKKLTIFLTILFCFVAVVDTSAKTRKRTKKRVRTTRVVKKKRVVPPTIHENPYLVCEKAGKIIGYVYAGRYSPRDAYNWTVTTSIYVDHECRRNRGASLHAG